MRRDIHDIGGGEGRAAGADAGREPKARFAIEAPKSAGRVLTALVSLALLASCAGAPKKPAYKKIPPAGKPPAGRAEPARPAPVPEAQRANVRPSTMDAVTPQRQASMRLVGKGKELLRAGDADRAASVLMDAVNVDSSNGVAYYYLAVASAKQGKAQVAEGLLDKAEALLGADEEWGARIDELRANLGAPGSDKILSSPIDVSF